MNDSELKFYDYMTEKMGIREENIKFNPIGSPDFIVKLREGEYNGYEVKTVKFKSIYIHNTQHIKIKNKNFKTFIVLMKKDIENPILMIPYDKIEDKTTQVIDGYKVYLTLFKKQDLSGRKEIVDIWKRLIIGLRNESIYERLNKILLEDIEKLDKIFKSSLGYSLVEDWKKTADWYGKEYKKGLNEIFKDYIDSESKIEVREK